LKARPPPRLRRAYFESRYGQLHVHNAIPAGGGFDELTTLICVHGTGQTGRAFAAVLAGLGGERSIYAPDLPGSGESDPAAGADATQAGLHAITDFLDSMRIRQVDVIALGDGAAIVRKLAAERPTQVRRVVLLAETGAKGPSVAQPSLSLDAAQAAAPTVASRLAEFLR
jgi:pimeloyl-ACP methyl ester carboxylesterase